MTETVADMPPETELVIIQPHPPAHTLAHQFWQDLLISVIENQEVMDTSGFISRIEAGFIRV